MTSKKLFAIALLTASTSIMADSDTRVYGSVVIADPNFSIAIGSGYPYPYAAPYYWAPPAPYYYPPARYYKHHRHYYQPYPYHNRNYGYRHDGRGGWGNPPPHGGWNDPPHHGGGGRPGHPGGRP